MTEYLDIFFANFTLAEVGLAIAIIFFATAVQYAMGIGFGTIVGPLLAIINIGFVPISTLILTFLTSSASLKSEFSQVSWIELRSSIGGRAIGAIFAAFALFWLTSEKSFVLVFGLIVGFFVLLSISGLKIPFNLKALGFAGVISGFTATITGVGGPPIALVYQEQEAKKARPTLQAFFVFASLISFLVLVAIGKVGVEHLVATIALLPGLLGGPLLGPLLRQYADQRFKYIILAITAVAAAILIYRGLS